MGEIGIIILVDKEEQLIVITTENAQDFDETADIIIEKLREMEIGDVKVNMN